MGGKRYFGQAVAAFWLWLSVLVAALLFAVQPVSASAIVLEPGSSAETVEGAASYLVQPPGEEIAVDAALTAYRAGRFSADMAQSNDGALHDWRTWIALPFRADTEAKGEMRKVIGLGGIFVELPRVYLLCGGAAPREILASQSGSNKPLKARYFTYVRTQSFAMQPGEACLALINVASNDKPNIGIFREGELGSNQVVAVLLKAGFTVTLLLIGIILTMVAYLTNRPLTMLMGIAYSVTMMQNEASLFSTTFSANAAEGRVIWEALTLAAIFACYWVFLAAFRREFRLVANPILGVPAALLPAPLIWVAYQSDRTPDLIWAFYLALLLFAVAVTLRFDVARKLRWAAGAVLFASVLASIAIEPYYLGRELTDLTIEFSRDVLRLTAGLAMLLLVLFDVVRTRRERDSMTEERIAGLERQAETDRRLLEAEREYARARDAASRRKAQLAAASHDIRQPIVGLKTALASEASNLSEPLQDRLNQAIEYLERLTNEYRPATEDGEETEQRDEEAYPVGLVLKAVGDMFGAEAKAAGVELVIGSSDRQTTVPALALIRATSNLVANALRHGQASELRVEARDEGELEIVVSDDGVGMDEATLARSQVSGRKGQKSDGDGLGLAIIHELARRHGFEFTMESQPGSGTTARLRLPI